MALAIVLCHRDENGKLHLIRVHAVQHRHIFLSQNVLDLSDTCVVRHDLHLKGALLLNDLGSRKSLLHSAGISPHKRRREDREGR